MRIYLKMQIQRRNKKQKQSSHSVDFICNLRISTTFKTILIKQKWEIFDNTPFSLGSTAFYQLSVVRSGINIQVLLHSFSPPLCFVFWFNETREKAVFFDLFQLISHFYFIFFISVSLLLDLRLKLIMKVSETTTSGRRCEYHNPIFNLEKLTQK